MGSTYNCPFCGRDKGSGLVILCPCKQPLEDEWILALLSFMAADLRLLPNKEAEIIDKTCVAITSYMRGRENIRR